MTEKEIKNLYEILRMEKSLYLFDKPSNSLTPNENVILDKLLDDIAHPMWKDIIINGEKTGYLINKLGEIQNPNGVIGHKDVCRYDSHNKYRSTRINGKTYLVHRLVAQAFIPNPENKPQVNHINGKKYCNWAGNLEWTTLKENMEHAVKTGLLNVKGENHPGNIYTENQIRLVCDLLQEGNKNPSEISKETGVPRAVISNIQNKETWTHISKDYNIIQKTYVSRYTDDEISMACSMLEDPNIPLYEIFMSTGVRTCTLSDITRGNAYKSIAKYYKICPRKKSGSNCSASKISEETAKKICELLCDTDMNLREIAKECNTTIDIVAGIHNRNSWKDISDNYDFPKKRKYKRTVSRISPETLQIISWINEGLTKDEVIFNIIKYQKIDNKRARIRYSSVLCKHKSKIKISVESSTTKWY